MKLHTMMLALSLALSSAASAEVLFSIDLSTKAVCRIDTASGAVAPLDPITDFNGTVTDMEFLGNRLFALANVSPNKRLLELDTTSGQIISSVVVTDGGMPIVNSAEGLGADDKGNLLISYWFPGTNATLSGQVGILGLDGAITFPMFLGRDMDGLCRRYAGGMFGLDREPGAGVDRNSVFLVTHSPPTSTDVNNIPFDTVLNGVDDLTQTRSGLYTLDFITKRVVRLSAANGVVLDSVAYDSAYIFAEVASPPPCPGDADGDRDRDFADITTVLTLFGSPVTASDIGDADGDGDVDFADITAVLQDFSAPCFQ